MTRQAPSSRSGTRGALGVPFVIAGVLESVYDVGFYVLFRDVEVACANVASTAATPPSDHAAIVAICLLVPPRRSKVE
jgi:hypothetical protein